MDGDGEIVLAPYIPCVLSKEEWERESRMWRIGKSYAEVRLSNANPRYRRKRGEILKTETRGGKRRYLLKIETVNNCTEDGFHTLVGVVYPYGYEDIWFSEDELERFESYDENGDEIPYCANPQNMI